GKRWASNLVKRQPELRIRCFRGCDYKGAGCGGPEAICGGLYLLWHRRVGY
ncbi:uncharacterized protein NECHADRAFT_9124, partial [Fusarium vanettenii 77-13-4]